MENLPEEVIIEVFDYLTSDELIRASNVCHQWLNIVQIPRFRSKIVLDIELDELDYSCSRRLKYSNVQLSFGNLRPNKCYQNLLFQITPSLEDLKTFSLRYVQLFDLQFLMLLLKMKNLKSLTLDSCDIDKNKIDCVEDRYLENLKNVMANLTELSISVNFLVCNWLMLMKIFTLTSQLQKIEIFLNLDEDDHAGVIPFTNIICDVIQKNKYTLKGLHTRVPRCGNNALISSIYQITDLNLEYLNIKFDSDLSPGTISADSFLQNHKNLTTLVISINGRKKLDLNLLAQNMNNLVKLKIKVDEYSIMKLNLLIISSFKKLKILKAVNHYRNEPHSLIFSSVDVARNLMLVEFCLDNIKLNNTDIIKISENLPNLEKLILDEISISNTGYQSIIKNLRKLKVLKLIPARDSEIITDFGISGFDSNTNQQTGVSIKELKNLEILCISGEVRVSNGCWIENLQFPNIFEMCIGVRPRIELDVGEEVWVNCPKLKSFTVRG